MTNNIDRLRQVVGQDFVLDDPASVLAYESDALSLFRSKPSAIVLPKTGEEIAACVRVLHQEGIPFTARGAGTGLSGGALVPEGGVILALARMDKIIEIIPEERLATVEPGVVNAALSREAKQYGLRYAPDPASQMVSTIGGNLAENAGGPQCFLHGTTTNHIQWVEVVLPDGAIEVWGNPSGEDDLDLRGFLTGSEGTVAIATSIGVRLLPIPEAVETFLASYPSMQSACETVSAIVAEGLAPVALEVMDNLAIQAVEDSTFRAGLPREAGAVLLVEIEGPELKIQEESISIEALLKERNPIECRRAENEQERKLLWKARKGAGGALGRLGPDTYVMDGVVPRSKLAEVMTFVEDIQKDVNLPVANLFHAGDGNIHPHFSYDARDPEQVRAVEEAGAKILRRCLELGGSLTGEHGIGLEKEHLLNEQFDSDSLALMERLRQAFNPADLLNPGKGLPLRRSCAEAFHRHGGVAGGSQ